MRILLASNDLHIEQPHIDLLTNADIIEGENQFEVLEDYDKKSTEEYVLVTHTSGFVGGWESLPADRLVGLKNLKGIVLATTAFGWVDGEKLRENGIDLMNTPGKSTNAIAEFNIFCMYALLRKFPLSFKKEDEGILEEAKGKVAGIIGLGAIGSRTAQLCESLGMEIIFYNRSEKETPWKQLSLEEVIAQSDVIFVTIADHPELHGLLNVEILKIMKSTAYLIFTSAQEILDLDYLIKAAGENQIGGLAFESDEMNMADLKGNVFIAPELAYYTRQTLRNEVDIALHTATEYVKGNKVNVVN